MTIGSHRRMGLMFGLLLVIGAAADTRAQNIDFAKIELQTVKITDGLYVLMGGPAQGNIAVSVGSDGLFLVDSMYGPMHQKIVDALKKISPQPIRYVVNTHLHGDHTAGNEAMSKLGAVIISHENMRKRMAAQTPAPPTGALPTLTYTDSLTLHLNGEEIYIYHPAPAHTDGDSIIYFKKANVVHVGDIPASLRYPNIGVNDGGTVDGMMAAARQLMKVVDDVRGGPGSDRGRDQGRQDRAGSRRIEADQGFRRRASRRRDYARPVRLAGLYGSVAEEMNPATVS